MNPVERVRILENIRQLSHGGQTTFVLVEHDMDIVFSLSEGPGWWCAPGGYLR